MIPISTSYISVPPPKKKIQIAIPNISEGETYNITLCPVKNKKKNKMVTIERIIQFFSICSHITSISSHIYKPNQNTLIEILSNDTGNASQIHVGQLQSPSIKVLMFGRVPNRLPMLPESLLGE